jgi:RNA polymerase sigma-70 factor (ECF subfamily)
LVAPPRNGASAAVNEREKLVVSSLITETKMSQADRFHALAWPHVHSVLRTARYITRHESDAEDLTQDTMLKAYRRIDRLREDGRASSWLRTITRNLHIDRARLRRRAEISLEEMNYDPGTRAEPCFTSEFCELDSHCKNPEAIIESFADENVIRAVRKLPRDIRWTLLLVDVQSLTEAEAADALKIPVGTVKSRLHRGRNMLRSLLEPTARQMRLLDGTDIPAA